jgi:hypothetical protein
MFSTYSDLAPILILLTLALSFMIGRNLTRENLRGVDGSLAALGFLFGLFMTLMNLVYTSKDLFLLSPVIAISCILYLRYHNELKGGPHSSLLEINNQNKVSSIVWWCLISMVLVTYYLSDIYTRHPLFFALISGAVAVLGVQIITSRNLNVTKVLIFIAKILLLSLILRASAYFVSPYPIGSDPWAHQEYVKYFLELGQVAVPSDFMFYYVNYPIAHLHAACTSLLASISPHNAMFLWGVILTLSTVVTFLIVRMLTGSAQLALVSMLLLNFVDAHIQWSVQVLAMSFGIAIYAFIIFFALKSHMKPKGKIKYIPLMLAFLGIIVWIHTISAFITLVSLFALVVGYILYEILYNRNILSFQSQSVRLLMIPLVFLAIIITYHWMDPSYSFFDHVLGGLLRSLSLEAEFLGATTLSNVHGRWEELLQPVGFCLYVFFGIFGTLHCLSHKEQTKNYFSLVILALVLFSICYAFPIFGMRDIVPDRWPAFASVCFVLFVGLGIFCALSLLKSKRIIFCMVVMFLFIGSFLMITNGATNHDSPLCGEEVFLKLIWTESEMNMYAHINETYDGMIFADEHTQNRPFRTYLKNKNAVSLWISQDEMVNTEALSSGLVVWRQDSLNRSVHVRDDRYVTQVLLGARFREYLDNNYCCILDVQSARSYLPLNSQNIIA